MKLPTQQVSSPTDEELKAQKRKAERWFVAMYLTAVLVFLIMIFVAWPQEPLVDQSSDCGKWSEGC